MHINLDYDKNYDLVKNFFNKKFRCKKISDVGLISIKNVLKHNYLF